MIFRKLSRHVLLSWPFLLIFSPINKFYRLWEKNPRLKPESSGKLQPVYHQASGLSTEDPLREFKRYNCLQDKIQWILEGKYKAIQGDRTKWGNACGTVDFIAELTMHIPPKLGAPYPVLWSVFQQIEREGESRGKCCKVRLQAENYL